MTESNTNNVKSPASRTSKASKTKCPICKKQTSEQMPTFPFCSKRCRTIDLGQWLNEGYVISRPIEQSDLEEGE